MRYHTKIINEDVIEAVYENVSKVYGPYQSKIDQRLRVVLANNDGTKTTVSYPKYLMEKYLNRYLLEDETVDHIDGNYLNNEISNLQILLRKDHAKIDVLRNRDLIVSCQWCGKEFRIKGSTISRRNRHNSGYFCSRRCSGLYGKAIQENCITTSYVDFVKPNKYKNKNVN